MFYTPDILCSRNRGKLSRVWLAATLSERLFKQSVSNKVLLSIRIDDICNEIVRIVTCSGHQQRMRFSLYLSSQLMYGTVKLFSYQISIFEASLVRIQYELRHVDFPQRRKKKRTSSRSDVTEEIDLPELPALKEVFKDLHLQADIHRLPEADFETVRAGHVRAFVKSPTFGVLTDEQVDLFLTEDDWQLQTLIDQNLIDLNEPIRYGADETNKRPILQPTPIEQQDLAISNRSRIIDHMKTVDATRDATLKTPKKRESKITDVDTPTKRRRRNLGAEMIAAGDRPPEDTRTIPPADFSGDQGACEAANIQMDFPDDRPIDEFPDVPTEIPARRSTTLPGADVEANALIDNTIPPPNRPEISAVPLDSELHLESLELEATLRPRNKRVRRNFMDVDTVLREGELARNIGNALAHTIPKVSSFAVPARGRIIPAISLLTIPSTAHHVESRDWLLNGSRYSKWAAVLRPAFMLRTVGPFITEDDHSMTVETIRAADSRIQPMPEETSSALTRAKESSSRNKTTDEPSAEVINPPAMPVLANDDYQLPEDGVHLGDIINVPIFEHTGDADTADMTTEPGCNVLPAVTSINEGDTNIVHSDGEVVQAEMNTTSETKTGDIDAFLPPKLRTRSTVKKTSHEKQPSEIAIVDIPDSPVSFRSERSVSPQSEWTKPDLQAQLAVLWASCAANQTITLANLVRPEDTSKLNAGVCFSLLLVLHKERIVNLAQEEPYGDIYIYKAVSRRAGPKLNVNSQ